MNRARLTAVFLFAAVLTAGVAHASWYDDYDAGVAAARAGNWSVVAAKMSAAIKGNPQESNKARTYGAIFINYHPYYYRGVANLNLGRYEQAIADLERTSAAGPENLGSVGDLLERAKRQLQAAQGTQAEPAPTRPEPAPTRPEPSRPEPVRPVVTTPAGPQLDAALRQRAASALGSAKQKLQRAQQRKATSSAQYAQAMSIYTDATARNASARSNDDLNSVINMAENAGDLADLAMAPSIATTPAPAPRPTKPAIVTDAVLADYRKQLRRALENYFNGEFEEASRDFSDLTLKLPDNAWVWAFLGASQYSQYAFEADEAHKTAALKSFRRAKELRTWKGGLPEKYFSKRIRRAFNEEG